MLGIQAAEMQCVMQYKYEYVDRVTVPRWSHLYEAISSVLLMPSDSEGIGIIQRALIEAYVVNKMIL